MTNWKKTLDVNAMSELGKKGGASRSERKREASRENLKKAREIARQRRLTIVETPNG